MKEFIELLPLYLAIIGAFTYTILKKYWDYKSNNNKKDK